MADEKKEKKDKFKLAKEFKAFISKGNVLDMAVGLIIGSAFTAIVNSVVGDLLMPVLGLITGKVDYSDDERDKIQLIAEDIVSLDSGGRDYYIAIRPEQEKPEIYEALKRIFKRHHGQNVVYMYFYGTKKLIKNEKYYWLDGSAEAEEEIRALLGNDSLKVK